MIARSAWLRMSALVVLLASSPARAGLVGYCSEPVVLPGPSVQVFLIPYEEEGIPSGPAEQMTTVLQRHVLFAALKYRGIAVSELIRTSTGCDPSKIARYVMARLGPTQSAVLLYGRMFAQEGTVHLQSQVLFLPGPARVAYRWPVGEGSVGAELPREPVGFAPRAIPVEFLAHLGRAQEAAQRVYSERSEESEHTILGNRTQFAVLSTGGDWLHVEFTEPWGKRDGWLIAHALAGGDALKGEFPELYFVDGVIGWLGLRGADDVGRLIDTRESFDRFVEASGAADEPKAKAAAHVLQGLAELAAQPGAEQAEFRALKNFGEARRAAPTDPTAAAFALALATSRCARAGCEDDREWLHGRLLQAVADDPTNPSLLRTLDTFYATLGQAPLRLDGERVDVARQRALIARSLEPAAPAPPNEHP